jgi:predicted transcriptional regulator
MSSKIMTDAPRPTGKQIRKALIDLDLSVLELSREMGVSPIYIRMIYQERRQARRLRKRIAAYLHKQYRQRGYTVPQAFSKQKEKAA